MSTEDRCEKLCINGYCKQYVYKSSIEFLQERLCYFHMKKKQGLIVTEIPEWLT